MEQIVSGTRFGQYEVVSLLGSGGMGDVYRARDTRLERQVALKLISPMFANDAERVARFEREARVLASINHANIAALYGFEQSGGRRFLVMELVEGETLAQRIARGPIAIEDALKIAHQITEALEAAHEKGIVHRDLKPANVKITPDGKVKVLDFGLAKAFAATPSGADLLSAPTLSVAATNAGVILGTPAYMSPEQARGQETDPRTDIFAFGSVLFEMLTGRRSFQGDTVTDAIASVLAREPELSGLPANIHPRIHDVLRRCLEKDPKRRWQAIGDVRIEIEAIMAEPRGLKLPAVRAKQALWKRLLPVFAAGIAGVAITSALAWSLRPASPAAALTRFSFTLPKDQVFTRTGRHLVAVSPDGANVVYVANQQLYLKPMAEAEAKAIPGTLQDVNSPFFSPDGKWIGYFAVPEGKLRKIALTGGAAVTLADVINPYGVEWYSADRILVGQGAKGIASVPANGGKPETVIAVKENEYAQNPQILPGGDNVLFTIATGTGDDRWERAKIVVQSIKSGPSGSPKVLIEGGSDAQYVPTGHIVYALGSTLFAVAFDAKKLQVTGGPVPIVEGLSPAVRPGANSASAFFSLSGNGSLVYIPGDVTGSGTRTLTLVSRDGEKKRIGIPAMPYYQPRISPDGKQLSVTTLEGHSATIWIYELSGTTAPRRLTSTGLNGYSIWTPDSQRVVFTSEREGDNGLFWQRADGSGVAERLATAEKDEPAEAESCSPDGKTLTFYKSRGPGKGFGIWMLTLDGDRKPRPLIDDPPHNASESSFSPDGHWIAYESDESGKSEVWVQPFPLTGAKYRITDGGGQHPRWSMDGKQLFYIPDDGPTRTRLAAVDIRTQPTFGFGKSEFLPIEGFHIDGEREYDITHDGKQFLVVLPASETTPSDHAPQQINVVLNWFEDLRRRAPVK